MSLLRIYTNDYDTFLALDRADLREAWREYIGAKSEADMADFDSWDWEEVADDTPIKIWCDPEGNPHEPNEKGNGLVTRTAREWADLQPRGLLCSTEI